MKELMTKDQFNEQMSAAHVLTDSQARDEQHAREAGGQVPVIRFVMFQAELKFDSLCRDVNSRAYPMDDIAPYFFETEQGAIRGIALWRRT